MDCEFATEKKKKLEEPFKMNESGDYLYEVPVTYCSHEDQKEDGLCVIVNKGKICSWFKEQAKSRS